MKKITEITEVKYVIYYFHKILQTSIKRLDPGGYLALDLLQPALSWKEAIKKKNLFLKEVQLFFPRNMI